MFLELKETQQEVLIETHEFRETQQEVLIETLETQ